MLTRRSLLQGLLAMTAGGIVMPEALTPLRRYWALGAMPHAATGGWVALGQVRIQVMTSISEGMFSRECVVWRDLDDASILATLKPGEYLVHAGARPEERFLRVVTSGVTTPSMWRSPHADFRISIVTPPRMTHPAPP